MNQAKNKKSKYTHLVMPFKFNEQYREYISVMISSTTIIQQWMNDMFDKNSNSLFHETLTDGWKEAEDVMESRSTLEFRGNLSLNEHVMRRFRYRSFSSLFWFSSQRKKKKRASDRSRYECGNDRCDQIWLKISQSNGTHFVRWKYSWT